MRELKRSIARSLMVDQGIAHINRKTLEVLDKEGKGTGVKISYFAKYWRTYLNRYIDPERFKVEDKKDRRISKQFRNRFLRGIRKSRGAR